MNTLLLLAALAAPLAAQEPAPAPPPAEVKDAAPAPEAPPAQTAAVDGKDVRPETPLVAEPAAAEIEAATKAAEELAKKHEAELAAKKAAAEKAEEPKVVVSSPKLEETKPLPGAGAAEEWAFVKSVSEDADPAVQDAAADELRLFARRHPDAPQAPEALALLAAARLKKGDWQFAAVALLRALHEYPESKGALRAKSSYLELIDKKASRQRRQALNDLAAASDAADKADRLSALWTRAAEKAPDAFYEAAADEVRDFSVRFPDHKDNDRLQAALARLHAANGKPAAAVLAWRKLLALYPASALRAQAQKAIGDLYADALRDPKKAIDAYQEVISGYPRAPEVSAALESSARLFEESLKQYDLAVEMDEKIVTLFPKTPGSLKALKAVARLQRERLGKPDEAIKTLLRLSAMHGGQDGVDALLLAADVARRDLKDYPREAVLRTQVSTDYPNAKEAPQALYDAAAVFESDAQNTAMAIDTYKKVASKYPSHKLAKKAADRAERIAGAK